nr:hypothetical protein [Tanacetum cinerariifolium]
MMDESDLTMEEYIELQAKIARRHGQTFNWETATYGKVYCDDLDYFTDFETNFLVIVYNDAYASNFDGLTKKMMQALIDRLRMVYIGVEGQELFTSHAWRRLFEIRASLLGGARRRMTWRQFNLALGLHPAEEMAKDGFEAYWGQAPKKVTAIDLFYPRSMDQGTANVPHTKGRKSESRMSGGYFIMHLAEHFGLVTDEGLMGLFVIACELLGPERQPIAAASVLEVTEGAPLVDESVLAFPTPVHAPQPPPDAAQLRLCLRRRPGSRRRFIGLERAWLSSKRSWTRWPETFLGLPLLGIRGFYNLMLLV